MTPEEKATAAATLRFLGCHPDWVVWFSRPGDEKNLKWLVDLFEAGRRRGWLVSDLYKEGPSQKWVLDYVNGYRKKQNDLRP
jgi:hypothetical protein